MNKAQLIKMYTLLIDLGNINFLLYYLHHLQTQQQNLNMFNNLYFVYQKTSNSSVFIKSKFS